MSQAQDPSLALAGFQEALTAGHILPRRSSLFSDLVELQDQTEDGTPRLTYALMDGKTVKALAVYFLQQVIDKIPCFDVGYAVAEPYRSQGLAHAVVEKSLVLLQQEMRGRISKFYIEAVVPASNLASQKVAARALDTCPEDIVDEVSGKPSSRYLKLFEV